MFFCQEKKNKQNNLYLNKNLLVSVNCCEEVVMQDCDVRFDFYFYYYMNALLCTNKKNYIRIKWSSSLCFALKILILKNFWCCFYFCRSSKSFIVACLSGRIEISFNIIKFTHQTTYDQTINYVSIYFKKLYVLNATPHTYLISVEKLVAAFFVSI